MICFLARFFIKDHKDVKKPEVRQGYGVLSGAFGIVLNFILFAIKLVAGISSSSIAIMGDAINNLSDAASSIVTIVGFKLSGQEADEEHPFGHGRLEYIAGLVVSFLIILTGVQLLEQSVKEILSPTRLEYSTMVIVILVISIIGKLIMFHANLQASKAIDSAALRSTAFDSISDVVATSLVLISTLISRYYGFKIDGFAGVIVSLFVLNAGIGSARDTINPLLGEPPSKDFITDIMVTVLKHKDAQGVHDITVHNYGPSRIFISLHVEISADMDIISAHDLIDDIEKELHEKYHCTAVIHMDPVVKHDERLADLRRIVYRVVEEIDPDLSFHDFRLVHADDNGEGKKLSFDLDVPYKYKMRDDELIECITDKMNELVPDLKIEITIDKGDI